MAGPIESEGIDNRVVDAPRQKGPMSKSRGAGRPALCIRQNGGGRSLGILTSQALALQLAEEIEREMRTSNNR